MKNIIIIIDEGLPKFDIAEKINCGNNNLSIYYVAENWKGITDRGLIDKIAMDFSSHVFCLLVTRDQRIRWQSLFLFKKFLWRTELDYSNMDIVVLDDYRKKFIVHFRNLTKKSVKSGTMCDEDLKKIMVQVINWYFQDHPF